MDASINKRKNVPLLKKIPTNDHEVFTAV